ncbi:hypothetical protein LCGC14_3147830, partial [marine sediment metagenome]
DGEQVLIHIKRMDYGEFQEFSARSTDLEKTVLDERIFRELDSHEQAKNEDGAYVIKWEELCRRRLQKMSVKERAEIEDAQTQRLKEQDDFLRECIERFIIHVEPGLVDIHDDGSKHPVIDGKGLIAVTGARRMFHLELYQAVFAENHLDERQKKVLRSQSGSSISSSEHDQVRPGRRRRTTAANAVTEGSAGNGAATRPRKARSGSGGRKRTRSSRKAAPSSH